MSNKNIPNSESVSTVDKDSSVLNSTASSPLKSSPLFGWLYAGSDLLSAKLDHAAGVVSQKIDDTQETINAMQAKGLEVESELKRTLNPFAIVDAAQKLVASTPLFSAFSGGQKRQQKEQQLASEGATKPSTTRTATKSGSANTSISRARKTSTAKSSTTAAKPSGTAKKTATGASSKRTAAKSSPTKSSASTKGITATNDTGSAASPSKGTKAEG